jgi:hypothetical protein
VGLNWAVAIGVADATPGQMGDRIWLKRGERPAQGFDVVEITSNRGQTRELLRNTPWIRAGTEQCGDLMAMLEQFGH